MKKRILTYAPLLLLSSIAPAFAAATNIVLDAGTHQAADIADKFVAGGEGNVLFLNTTSAGTFLNIADGQTYATTGIYIGGSSASDPINTMTISGGSTLSLSVQYVLGSSTNRDGILVVDGATLKSNSSYIGREAGSSGTVSVTNGTYTGTTLNIGGDGTVAKAVLTGILGVFGATNSMVTASNANVGIASASSAQLNLYGTTYSGANMTISAGTSAAAVASIKDSSVTLTGGLRIGAGTASSGTLNLIGTTSMQAGYMQMGRNAGGSSELNLSDTAQLTLQTGGSDAAIVANSTGHVSTISLQGGSSLTLNVAYAHFGQGNSAGTAISLTDTASMTLNYLSAVATAGVTDIANFACGANSSTSVNISGSAVLNDNYTTTNFGLGTNAVANLTVTGGEMNGGTWNFAAGVNSDANVTVSGGMVSLGNATLSAGSGSATVITMTGGEMNVNGLRLCAGTNSTTTMNVGGTASVSADYVQFGRAAGASGSMVLSDNAQLFSGANGDFLMGAAANVTSSVAISGNASLTTDAAKNLNIAGNANNVATLSMTGGTLNVGSGLNVAAGTTSSGVLNISGGTATTGGVLYVAVNPNAVGTVSVTGGTLNVGTWLTIGNGNDSVASFTVDGGNVAVGNSVTVARTGDRTGVAATLSILSGTLSSTQGISVNDGGTLIINSGASVGGAVILTGDMNLSISGSTDAGANAITLDNMVVNEGGEIAINLASFDITGESSVTLLTLGTAGTTLENATVTVSGYDNTLWKVATEWNAGNTALLATISTIPEPAASACLLGLLGLAFVARRRK